VFNRYFSTTFDRFYERKWIIVGIVAIVTIVAGIGLKSVSFDNNIELMLPCDDDIRRSMRFLRESNFSDKVIISLRLESHDHTIQDLIQAVDRVSERLGPPYITEVVKGVSGTGLMEEMLSFMKYVPQLTGEKALLRIDKKITPEGVKASLRRNYLKLLTPASIFMMPFVRSDPLGINADVLHSLNKLSSAAGYKIEIENGHFVSRDRVHAMLILETPVTLTDTLGSRNLISYLHKQLKFLPDFVSADIIAGHLHTVSNEDVIKGDVRLALTVASIAFLLLFLFMFRDVRAIMLFLIPLASVLVSINLSYMVLDHLSYFIVGMGGVVAGIAIDYGIHVYMAIRSSNGKPEAVKHIARPVVTGALTTMGVFAAFFFSSVQGYHQLAFFSIFSIVLCLAYALFVLPYFLGRNQQRSSNRSIAKTPFTRFTDHSEVVIICWIVAMIGTAISIRHLTFNSDVRQFDGSEPEVFQAEQEFHRVWGGQDQPAVLIVSGKNLDETLRRNAVVYQDAVAAVGKDNFSSLAQIWPLEKQRIANTMRWNDFWRQGRELKLRKLLHDYGTVYNFSEDAFSPFFENLYASTGGKNDPVELPLFNKLKERFVLKKQDGYQVLSFFPDTNRHINQLSAVSDRYPGTFLVSRNALAQALSRSVSSEIIYLSTIAAILIPILTFLLLRDIRLAGIALVPVITGITAVLGMLPILGLFLDAPSVIAAMVVVGLCIDYGIFMVYACHYNLKTGTFTAVTLSAITTIIGAGVLVFARHPMLFSIGVTMVTGVLAGCVSSILVVPSFYRQSFKEGTKPS